MARQSNYPHHPPLHRFLCHLQIPVPSGYLNHSPNEHHPQNELSIDHLQDEKDAPSCEQLRDCATTRGAMLSWRGWGLQRAPSAQIPSRLLPSAKSRPRSFHYLYGEVLQISWSLRSWQDERAKDGEMENSKGGKFGNHSGDGLPPSGRFRLVNGEVLYASLPPHDESHGFHRREGSRASHRRDEFLLTHQGDGQRAFHRRDGSRASRLRDEFRSTHPCDGSRAFHRRDESRSLQSGDF